jgi:hypothetical protein
MWTRRPQCHIRVFLVVVLGAGACAWEDPPTADVKPQFEGIGPCCWNPDWLGPSLYFAPIIYQDVDASWADFITRFTFDNEWNGGNNWENTFAYPLRAFVYASMVETFAHYFIFYGFFHPRDWCTQFWCHDLGPFGGPYDVHENDLEGVMVTVDKRFTTPEWPYGQIVTIETVFHNETYPAYRNCAFTGYTIIPSWAFKTYQTWDGCIVWEVDDMMFSFETPPVRPAIFVQARGHGVNMRDANWDGFPGGDGVIYFPGDGEGEVPPSVLSPPVAYGLQWTTLHELWFEYPKSLWSKRLTSGGLYTSTYRYLHQDPVGPWDVLYGHDLNCVGQPCGANAPWGMKNDGLSSVHRGDWHNHPAWTWSQHYEPGPTWNDSLYYPYCRAAECRMVSSMYETNYFWDPTSAPQDYVDFHVTSAEPAPGRLRSDAKIIPPELRWEFDTLPPIEVSGTRAVASQLRVDDSDWGYRSGTTGVLRVEGEGPIQVTLPAAIDPSVFQYVYVRFRRVAGSARTMALAWLAVGEFTVPAGRRAELSARRAGAWDVAMIPLADQPGWTAASDVAAIVLFLEGQGPAVIDVDFVIVAP